ncbi:hypothetical protein A2U01_0103858, partial [Trifolium medium]|nr:hypothetical protein [Trifolium medium]
PDPPGYTSNSLAPDSLVELDIDPNVVSAHGLLSKFSYLLDSFWCLLFEGAVLRSIKSRKHSQKL